MVELKSNIRDSEYIRELDAKHKNRKRSNGALTRADRLHEYDGKNKCTNCVHHERN